MHTALKDPFWDEIRRISLRRPPPTQQEVAIRHSFYLLLDYLRRSTKVDDDNDPTTPNIIFKYCVRIV
jgi:hypothetical protein